MPTVPPEILMQVSLQFMQTMVNAYATSVSSTPAEEGESTDDVFVSFMPKPETVARYAFDLVFAAVQEANR